MAVDLDTLIQIVPQIGLAIRWREVFGEGLPTVGGLVSPDSADWLVLEAGDPEIFWDWIRAEIESGIIR